MAKVSGQARTTTIGLAPGIYFWEANPVRGIEFARESLRRRSARVKEPFVVGAVIDLGLCLDLTAASGIGVVKSAFEALQSVVLAAGSHLPANHSDGLRRNLDCAVIRYVHDLQRAEGWPPIDTVKGIFREGSPVYPGAGFYDKTHVQIAVCNSACIKGVFRVPSSELQAP